MRARRGRLEKAGGTVLLLLLLSPALVCGEKRYDAERFDVQVRLQEDGTALVTEDVVFRFEGGTFTRVTRELPLRKTDGIEVLEGGLDDVALGGGRAAGPARLEVSRHDGTLRVVWRFAPAEGSHRFTLRYLVRGLVERKPGEDELAWTALPRDHEYRIATSRITFVWPPSVRPRQIEAGGRSAAVGDSGAAFDLQRLAPDESITLRATFDPGTAAAQPPQWQQRAERQRRSAPTWVAVAASVFVGFTGLLWLLWARSPRPGGKEAFGGVTVSEPPDRLPPALAGALVSGGGAPSSRHAMAGLLDLADRGLLRIEEQPPRRWRAREFVLRSVGGEGAWSSLRPHERALLHAALTKKNKTEAEVPMAAVAARMVGASRRVSRAAREELIAAGLLDPERLRARRHLLVAALVVLGLGLLYVPVAILLFERYGPWPLLVLPALDSAGLIGILLSASLRPHTDEGLRLRERWKGYSAYLRRAARKDETSIPVSAAALPFAVAFGAAAAYARALHRRREALPSWFQAASAAADKQGDAFVTLMAAGGWTGSSSSGAGAGGAGGAAGGGSSSAS